MQLDVKIRQGEATDAEDDTYAKLVPRKAEQRVQDYQRSPEELEQKLEEHYTKFGHDQDCTIKTVEQFIDVTAETSQLDVDYLWTYTDRQFEYKGVKFRDGEQYYTACLCRMPEMKC